MRLAFISPSCKEGGSYPLHSVFVNCSPKSLTYVSVSIVIRSEGVLNVRLRPWHPGVSFTGLQKMMRHRNKENQCMCTLSINNYDHVPTNGVLCLGVQAAKETEELSRVWRDRQLAGKINRQHSTWSEQGKGTVYRVEGEGGEATRILQGGGEACGAIRFRSCTLKHFLNAYYVPGIVEVLFSLQS